MCQEIFRMALGMDLKSVEMQLALQCAPLITGVRISNLLMIESCNEPALRLVLKRSGISYFKLGQTEGKTAFLLFKRTKLEEFLQKNDSLEILKSSGYEEFSFGSILLKFKERYTTYITQQGMQFPHEMGLLLGYPTEDVEGFISNEGKNSLYCGYWKYIKMNHVRWLFRRQIMSKISVVYWSQSGNTAAMAEAVAKGITDAGKEAEIVFVSSASIDELKNETAFALGCPAMGAEVLEESEMEPFVTELEASVSGKTIGLFGSYGWGDGVWMRDWVDRMTAAGATVAGGEGVICQDAPDDDAKADCEALGKSLAAV